MAKKDEKDEAVVDEAADEALGRLSDQVDQAIRTIRDLKKENAGLEERIGELQARIDELESEAGRAKELEEQHSALADEKALIRGRIEAILEKFEELEGD